jgi:HAMP domain-containing protein
MSDSYELKILGVVILIELVIAGVGATIDKANTWVWMIIPSLVFSLVYFGFLRWVGRSRARPAQRSAPKIPKKLAKRIDLDNDGGPETKVPEPKQNPPGPLPVPNEPESTADAEKDVEKQEEYIEEVKKAQQENEKLVAKYKKDEEKLKETYEQTQVELTIAIESLEEKEDELDEANKNASKNTEAQDEYNRKYQEYEEEKKKIEELKERGIESFTLEERKQLKNDGYLVNVRTKTRNASESRKVREARAVEVQSKTPGDLATQFEKKWGDNRPELVSKIDKLATDLGVKIIKSEISQNVDGATLEAFKEIVNAIQKLDAKDLSAKLNAMAVLSEAAKLSSQEFEFKTPKEPKKPKLVGAGTDKLEAEIGRLKAEIERLTDLLDKINKQVAKAGTDLGAAMANKADLAKQAEKAKNALTAAKARVAMQAAQAEKAKESAKARQARLADKAKEAEKAKRARKLQNAKNAATAEFGSGAGTGRLARGAR